MPLKPAPRPSHARCARRRATRFELATLERRLLMASTPASPRPETLGTLFDATERQIIVNRFSNAPLATRNDLQAKLNTSVGAFDAVLQGYIRSRTNARWYFDDADTADYVSFLLGTTIGYSATLDRANAVVDFHKFPEQGGSETYTVDLPDSINWITPGGSTNPEFLHTLNRHQFFLELAYAHRITGQAKYAEELAYEIASWSQQHPTMNVPAAYSTLDKQGWLFDTALRAENWASAYFMMLGSDGFSGADGALMVYKLIQMGDYLQGQAQQVKPADFASNRTLSLGRSLLLLGQMFPEVNSGPTWESTGRNLLFNAMRGQLYGDGSHVEQSPTYAAAVAEDLVEARLLDQLNGDDAAWTADPDGAGPMKKASTIVSNAVTSYLQTLSPDGNRPAIGDTYRNSSVTLFLKANLVQGATLWPAAKPRLRDLFLFGPDRINPFLGNPGTPPLGERGASYAMTEGGLYISRSDSTPNATQLIFDVGPKGGIHGHFDLLNFELFAGGRPLILDPGAYIYDPEHPDRKYVVSTRAHNTLNVDGANTGELEGSGNPGFRVHQYSVVGSVTTITASHRGYAHLPGSPIVVRSIRFDAANGTMLIVDRVESTTTHNYQISFNLAGDASAATTGVQPDNSFRTRYPTGGNVKVMPVFVNGGTVARGGLTFVTNTADGDYKDDAYRFTVTRNGVKSAVFVTLVSVYTGTSVPNISASLLTASPTATGTVAVRLNDNGSTTDVSFAAPSFQRLNANAQSNGTWNDIKYDAAGRLHKAWYDPADKSLKYAVREVDGQWNPAQTILNPVSLTIPGEYQYLSLALNSKGKPGLAYFDGWDGDLGYAHLDTVTNAWKSQKVESLGSVGLYPSLAFSRNDGPVITYYHRTKGDLHMALSQGTGWQILTIDSAGDVGRFSSLTLDPNRPTASKWAIAYEDSTNGRVKYAVQGDIGPGPVINGYTQYIVEDMGISGGYISLAFFKSGSTDPARAFLPAVSYYDGALSRLKFAYSRDPNFNFTPTVITAKRQGLYSRLFFTGPSQNVINLYYFDRVNNYAKRFTATLNYAAKTISGSAHTLLAEGGRELHVAQSPLTGGVAYTTLNSSAGTLRTIFL